MIEHLDVDVGDDVHLHVVVSGQGPALTLLHGFTGSAETWDFLRPELDSKYRIVAVDLPGHGRSSSPFDPARYTLGRFANDLAKVFDAVDVERGCVLGYSMGGRAALRFAIDHPGRTSGLILESTSPGLANAAERQARIASDALLADLIEKDGVDAFVSRWEKLPLWESQQSLPDAGRHALRAQRLSNSPRGLANSLRGAGAGSDVDVLSAAASITASVLIIAGDLDAKYVELGRRLAGTIPHAELMLVKGSGHATHLEQPRAFIDSVAAFLAKIPPA